MIEPIVTSSLSIVSSSPAVIDTVTALLILSGCSEKIDALKMYTHLYNMDTIIWVTMPAFNTWAQTHVQCSIFDCCYISGDYHELLVVVCSLFHLLLIFIHHRMEGLYPWWYFLVTCSLISRSLNGWSLGIRLTELCTKQKCLCCAWLKYKLEDG